MSNKALKRAGVVIFLATCMFAVSACWGANETTADPGAVFHHDFSLVPGVAPGKLTSCWEVRSRIPDTKKYVCRVVEGDERVGQPGNWDVKFDGGDHPIASTCIDAFSLYKCIMVAPDGMVYEGCFPYPDNGVAVWWCDYRSKQFFTLETHTSNWLIWNTFWNWGTKGVANELQCAYGLMGLYSGESQLGDDWLVSCFEGPL